MVGILVAAGPSLTRGLLRLSLKNAQATPAHTTTTVSTTDTSTLGEENTYTACQVFGKWYSCQINSLGSNEYGNRYRFHTIGKEFDWQILCYNPVYANQSTTGLLYNQLEDNVEPIDCRFNISTRSERSISFNSPGTEYGVTMRFDHNIGR